MTIMVRSCMQSSLKLVNSLIGVFGIATILYAVWMIKIWQQRQLDDSNHLAPWFMYTVLGFRAILCAITCWGYIAAETANGCCLYCYIMFMFCLLMLEGAVTLDVFLNSNWEKDFPQDLSGNFDDLRDFIKENLDSCKWVGLSILSVEGLCVFLGMILIAIGPHEICYDECTPERVPLLKQFSNQPHCVNMRPLHSSITCHL